MLNKVAALFKLELNELSIAPKITAAKKPSRGAGNTLSTRAPYESSASIASPNICHAIIPGRTKYKGPKSFIPAAKSTPFCPSAKLLDAKVR